MVSKSLFKKLEKWGHKKTKLNSTERAISKAETQAIVHELRRLRESSVFVKKEKKLPINILGAKDQFFK